MMMAAPAFQNLMVGPVQQEANRMAGVVRMLRNEAVLTHTTFRLMLDMTEKRYSVEQRLPDGTFAAREDPAMLRPHSFPTAFQLKELIMFGDVVSREGGRTVPIVIDASGFIDPFQLRFSDAGKPYACQVKGLTGNVQLGEGFVEP